MEGWREREEGSGGGRERKREAGKTGGREPGGESIHCKNDWRNLDILCF